MKAKSAAIALMALFAAACAPGEKPAEPKAADEAAASSAAPAPATAPADAPTSDTSAPTTAPTGTETMALQKTDLAPGTGAEIKSGQSALVHYTGYERPAETIPLNDTLLRRVGHMLGTADIMAQMADRCYLEKCRDRLYPEFVLGGLAKKKLPGGRTQILFSSGVDLVRKTPGFYMNAAKRLDLQLARAYEYAERHFNGQNLYLEEMQKNVRYAQAVRDAGRVLGVPFADVDRVARRRGQRRAHRGPPARHRDRDPSDPSCRRPRRRCSRPAGRAG